MNEAPEFTMLYQINTRTSLNAIADRLGRPATLDDFPDAELERIAGLGFNWVYMLGIWETGALGLQISLHNLPLRQELERVLPDLREEDIASSCFAISRYRVDSIIGGDAALARLRERMHRVGMRVMLDFVPNHTAMDHHWAWDHPEYFINGSKSDLREKPDVYFRAQTAHGPRILAHARDPYFPAWIDTLQVDYSNPELQQAMAAELLRIAGLCDGLRCDMAMLLLPEVIQNTWGRIAEPFWPHAIAGVKAAFPNFTFLAEVYWQLEGALQEQGFDFTYDKRYYDSLVAQDPDRVLLHLEMAPAMLYRMAHFLENHDEPRSAARFPLPVHQAAAVLTYFVPGLRFFQQGQLEGHRTRIPMQLRRAPHEEPDKDIQAFYSSLLKGLHHPAIRTGQWSLLDALPVGRWDTVCREYIAFAWRNGQKSEIWVVVNFTPHPGLCTLRLPFEDYRGRSLHLQDILSDMQMDVSGDELLHAGLTLELQPWGVHLFEVQLS